MSKRYINKEKVYLLEEYKKKLYNSEIEYNRFREEVHSMIDEYIRGANQTISNNNIKRVADRLGTFVEVLTDAETYNTLVISDYLCHVNDKCNAKAMVDTYKKIIELRDHDTHFCMYNYTKDTEDLNANIINKELLTHKYDSIYVDAWAMSVLYNGKLDTMINSIPCGTRIYFLNSNNVMNEAICMRKTHM